jgi:hypothetical protein
MRLSDLCTEQCIGDGAAMVEILAALSEMDLTDLARTLRIWRD